MQSLLLRIMFLVINSRHIIIVLPLTLDEASRTVTGVAGPSWPRSDAGGGGGAASSPALVHARSTLLLVNAQQCSRKLVQPYAITLSGF